MLRVDINLLFTIINLLLLFIALRIFLFKPVQNIIDARQKEADSELEEAKTKQKEADELKAQYEASLAQAQDEKKEIIKKARQDADVEYQKILDDAKKKAEDVKKAAEVEAQNKKEQIIKSAETEITSMVVDAATKVVGNANGKEADIALYDKFLDKAGDEA